MPLVVRSAPGRPQNPPLAPCCEASFLSSATELQWMVPIGEVNKFLLQGPKCLVPAVAEENTSQRLTSHV